MSDKRIHAPIHEKETENTVSNRGEGGVMHQTMITKPLGKRNPKIAPNRSDARQKRYKCIPKTLIPSHPSKKTHDHSPTREKTNITATVTIPQKPL